MPLWHSVHHYSLLMSRARRTVLEIPCPWYSWLKSRDSSIVLILNGKSMNNISSSKARIFLQCIRSYNENVNSNRLYYFCTMIFCIPFKTGLYYYHHCLNVVTMIIMIIFFNKQSIFRKIKICDWFKNDD